MRLALNIFRWAKIFILRVPNQFLFLIFSHALLNLIKVLQNLINFTVQHKNGIIYTPQTNKNSNVAYSVSWLIVSHPFEYFKFRS